MDDGRGLDDAVATEFVGEQAAHRGVSAFWAERATGEVDRLAVAALHAFEDVALVDLSPESWSLHSDDLVPVLGDVVLSVAPLSSPH
jgi:hypothetical protein